MEGLVGVVVVGWEVFAICCLVSTESLRGFENEKGHRSSEILNILGSGNDEKAIAYQRFYIS